MSDLLQKRVSNKKGHFCLLNFSSSTECPVLIKKTNYPTIYQISVKSGVKATVIFADVSRIKIEAIVDKDAEFNITTVISETNQVELNSEVKLKGRGAMVNQNIIALSSNQENISINCILNHLAPQTYGRIISRRVLAGSSQSTLYGMLKIAPGAYSTDTYLSDKVILIGDKARAESVPSLEILTDEVKASHGATIGKMSPDELFYLRSRGLSLSDAQTLLLRAFIQPVLTGVDSNIVEHLLKKLNKL